MLSYVFRKAGNDLKISIVFKTHDCLIVNFDCKLKFNDFPRKRNLFFRTRSLSLKKHAERRNRTKLNWPVSESGLVQLYPVYTIKQSSSNYQANIQQMHSKCACTTCALIAWCLLDVCLMFAWWLFRVGYALYPVHTIEQTSSRHRANVEQTSSKHWANIEQIWSMHKA